MHPAGEWLPVISPRFLITVGMAISLLAPLAAQSPNLPSPALGPKVSKEQARQNLHSDLQAKIAELLDLHNRARAQVGVPPLEWNPELASRAQQWADYLVLHGGLLRHSDSDDGENLATFRPANGERPVHGAMLWYAERGRYNGETISDSNYRDFGHYTQMVWRTTTRVGFGMAVGPDGRAILVARYLEAGNMVGEKAY